MWDEMQAIEIDFSKTPRNSPNYKAKFELFKYKGKTFDKHNKRSKRQHQRQQVLNIEKANTEDPAAFWDFIQKLSPCNTENFLGNIQEL